MPSQYPSERTTFSDAQTGATVIQWTAGPSNNHHLYFTSLSVTADDRWLTFISDRTGHPNLFAIDRTSGEIRRLSDNQRGLLRSYVYPQGGLTGLSKASPCLDPRANRLLYVRDDKVFAVSLGSANPAENFIAELPPQWFGGYSHISPDGKTYCIPCTDPRAFADEKTQWEQLKTVPVRMKALNLLTRLYFIDIATGRTRVAAEVPFWVTHVQFDPAGTGRLIFNLEGQQANGVPMPDRIWCLESSGHFRPLATHLPAEWRSHENWAPDGQSILYHGGHADRAYVAARTWDGKLLHETSIHGVEFWHATGVLDGRRFFVDRRDGVISILDPAAAPAHRVIDLCRHDTAMHSQDAHAHPITTPSGKSLVFTSSRSGTCQVYEVTLPPAAWPTPGV